MSVLPLLAGALLLVIVLLDAFETVILPRRASRRIRLTSLFFILTWQPWAAMARRMRSARRRETFLGFYGPFSMILLLAVWAAALVLAFGLIQWGAGSGMRDGGRIGDFGTDVYMSGTTFFTLGLGDVVPSSRFARVLTVVEAGTGFGFLALVIGYLPVLYAAFSRREVAISMLDARAGSPPTAGELLARHGVAAWARELVALFERWELWAAELLESHLSFPVLCYYRSQHDNQSWVASLTSILDACALSIAGSGGEAARQARLTFAIARHAVVDIGQNLGLGPRPPEPDRLPPDQLQELRSALARAGVPVCGAPEFAERLRDLRRMYEPWVGALANHLLMGLPDFAPAAGIPENWRSSAFDRRSLAPASLGPLVRSAVDEEL